MLIAGEGNDGQDLSMSEVTGNSATTITASSSPTTSSAAMPSTVATSSRDDTQGKRKGNGKHQVNK